MLTYKKSSPIPLLFAVVILFVWMSLKQSCESIKMEEYNKAKENIRQIKDLEKLEKIMRENNLIFPEAPNDPKPIPARFTKDIACLIINHQVGHQFI